MRLNEKRKSVYVQKCIENAVNNAVNNFGMKRERLVVKEAVIGKGVYTRMISIHGRGEQKTTSFFLFFFIFSAQDEPES
jgi:ribosomal protein L22